MSATSITTQGVTPQDVRNRKWSEGNVWPPLIGSLTEKDVTEGQVLRMKQNNDTDYQRLLTDLEQQDRKIAELKAKFHKLGLYPHSPNGSGSSQLPQGLPSDILIPTAPPLMRSPAHQKQEVIKSLMSELSSLRHRRYEAMKGPNPTLMRFPQEQEKEIITTLMSELSSLRHRRGKTIKDLEIKLKRLSETATNNAGDDKTKQLENEIEGLFASLGEQSAEIAPLKIELQKLLGQKSEGNPHEPTMLNTGRTDASTQASARDGEDEEVNERIDRLQRCEKATDTHVGQLRGMVNNLHGGRAPQMSTGRNGNGFYGEQLLPVTPTIKISSPSTTWPQHNLLSDLSSDDGIEAATPTKDATTGRPRAVGTSGKMIMPLGTGSKIKKPTTPTTTVSRPHVPRVWQPKGVKASSTTQAATATTAPVSQSSRPQFSRPHPHRVRLRTGKPIFSGNPPQSR